MAINNQSHRRVRADSHAYPVFGLSSVWGESKDQTSTGRYNRLPITFRFDDNTSGRINVTL